MRYAILYSSKTGNTARLAEAIRGCLPARDCAFFGSPGAELPDAELYFVGFWTDKGSCGEEIAALLRKLEGKQVFLFGTAGFGGDEAYFAQITERVVQNLPASATLLGSYLCQGRMPDTVRQRYEAMAQQAPAKAAELLANFDRALLHPDESDPAGLRRAVTALAKSWQ